MDNIEPDIVLDTKGMNCPMPVLKTKKTIDTLQAGQILKVMSTDPGSKSDISILINRLGHELLQINEESGVIEFYIRKK
jgi:tRNA 2-thiouridine synthesizing protein A